MYLKMLKYDLLNHNKCLTDVLKTCHLPTSLGDPSHVKHCSLYNGVNMENFNYSRKHHF